LWRSIARADFLFSAHSAKFTQEIQHMNWITWLKGLAAVAIGGAAAGVANALGNGQLNRSTLITAAIGALTTVIAYLLKSPVGSAVATAVTQPVAPQAPSSAT
jgi:hypothetical protein